MAGYRLSGAAKVYVKEYRVGGDIIVAACDEELLGNRLVDGDLEFYVDPAFYGGRLALVEEALSMIEASTIANLVGENIVSAAVERGLVHPRAIVRIQGVPHAQIVKILGG